MHEQFGVARHADERDQVRLDSALTAATFDIGITLPRPLLLRLYEATVDELVDAGCVLLEPDDEKRQRC